MANAAQLPTATVSPQSTVMAGGVDLLSAPGYAQAGTCRFALNYESEFGGGYRRIGGFERFSGQPAPSDAQYTLVESTTAFTSVAIGNTVTGQTTGGTAVVYYISADSKQLGLTKRVGTTLTTEVLKVGATTIGTITSVEPVIDGFLDNELAEGAANVYRADIARPAGTLAVRGVAILNNVVYCWRNVSNALITYKSTAAGWVVVPYYSQVTFSSGSAVFLEGGSLIQGGATATVKRVVLQTGSWAAGTAAGRLIIAPISGSFAAGTAGGSGIATLAGPAAQITMNDGGKVSSVVGNFTASLNTRRLYCADGINPEFEFDGDILVPISTGMGAVRSKFVAIHKNHLFFLYNGSLQHSGVGAPYSWTPITGAGELGTGDIGTNLVNVAGSESNAALMVACQDSIWVLYGNSSLDWDFRKISDEAGAQAYSAQPLGSPIAFDRDGFTKYTPTQAFGNFSYESASRSIDPLVRNGKVKASVLIKNKGRYRCFFGDGLFVTGTPEGEGYSWMPCNYERIIECAVGGEIDGQYRVFYGDSTGWVLEADVGRSFDGEAVEAYLRLSSQNQGSDVTLKQYRHVEFANQAESAFEMAVAAEFSDSDPDIAGVTEESILAFKKQYGAGLFWDFESWDRAYWDVAASSRVRYAMHGQGRSISLLVRSFSTNQLPHTLKSNTVLFTPRRLAR